MAGVPESNFMQVKSPFNLNSYKDMLDADTALVFVRSQKDITEQTLPDQTKKNGKPGYLRTYTGKDLNTADEMGYMAYGPTINFDFSGMQIKSASELRATWPEMSDEDKLKAAKLMYGNGAPVAVKLLNQALGDTEAPVGEDASSDEEDEFHRKLDKLVHKTFGHSSDEKKKKKKKYDEADLVLDRQALVKYIKDQIQDYVNREDSVENLSALLKYIAGRQITAKGKRFVISKEDIQEALSIIERELSKGEEKEKERIVKGMKKNKDDFKKRYGDDAEAVMYATATKMAKK